MNGAVCARCSLFKCLSFLCGFVSFVTDERSGCAEGEVGKEAASGGSADRCACAQCGAQFGGQGRGPRPGRGGAGGPRAGYGKAYTALL